MAKKCTSDYENDRMHIERATDAEIMGGITSHANPEWWKEGYVQRTNQAYLRRWGSILRREARKRGLI